MRSAADLDVAMRTRGQPAALSAVRAMLASGFPHAILLTGPAGVGKTTLALDIARALLCTAEDASARPCGTCRGCRMVDHGNHPDLHRLAPVGAGSVIPIGGRDDRGVRDLVAELALLPVEGGARVAVVEGAHRMTEDAQSAFLKTLEEPPSGTTIVICTDDEERVLPTIRSRCVRIRLGPMGAREIETILVEHGVADPPSASRLARLAGGRPGMAIAYALAPEAATIRGEISRTLLDMRTGTRTARLTGMRDLAARAAELVRALDLGAARLAGDDTARAAAGRGRGRARRTSASETGRAGPVASGSSAGSTPDGASDGSSQTSPEAAEAPVAEEPVGRVPPAERRRAALVLVDIWRELLRDVTVVALGERAAVRDLALHDDLEAAAPAIGAEGAAEFLRRLDVAGERLEGNVSPELVLDVLALAWGRAVSPSGSASIRLAAGSSKPGSPVR